MTAARHRHAWIRLSLCRSVGPATWNRWLIELDHQGLTLADFLDLPAHRARPFVRNWPAVAQALRREAPPGDRVRRIAAWLDREGIRLIAITDSLYPARLLRDLGIQAPTFLFVAGNLTHLRAPTVAVVGTRWPSPAGATTARAYAAALARAGIHVVSGQARGIDTAAHEAALRAGGSTTLVLPRGLYDFQPAAPLRPHLTHDNALVLSQFPPHAKSGTDLPIRRNATIAALGDGLIVIESGLVGGTSHAFRAARHLRRPRWAVVYREPVPPSAAGNHSLLSAGAEPLEPGEAGARRCTAAVVERLRAAHAQCPRSAAWPPIDRPGQDDLFERRKERSDKTRYTE